MISSKMTKLDTVLKLRDLGLCIIPSGGGNDGKHPRVSNDLTKDKWEVFQNKFPSEKLYEWWWETLKPVLWGVVTGEISDVVVVDCDSDEAVTIMGDLKPHVRTPRGGSHYYFKHPGHHVKTQVGILTKVDIRADGGFANIIGTNPALGGKYHIEIMPTPEAIYPWEQIPEAILGAMVKGKPKAKSETEPGEPIPEGERNSTLTSLAGSMRRPGMTSEEIFAGLREVNRLRCKPPLKVEEIHVIAESIAKKEPAAKVHRSDTGNATMLVNEYGDTLRYDHKRKRWLRWGKHRWETNYDGHISRLAQKIAKKRYTQAANIQDLEERKRESGWAIASEQRAKIDGCVALVRIMEPVADDGTNWDRGIELLGTPNGVVDLRTGELRPGKADDRITMSTGVDFNPDAKCPRWEQFLTEIFEEAELIDWLWRSLGYSIIGETVEQIFMVGYGEGSNGKSRFLEAIGNALGDYAYYTPFATFSLPAPSSTNDLAALEHRRFVTSSETNIGTKLNIERIKAISGGDKMTARFLYQEYETYQPHLKLWLFVNHLPDVADDTIATWRRIRLIPFTKTFIRGAEDKHLGDKLKAEAEGILAWLVRGCLEWQNRGLVPVPECIRAATGEYRKETDTIISFIDDRCVKGKGKEIRARRFYFAYESWATGIVDKHKVLSETAFGRQMGKRFEKRSDRKGVYYLGIDLRDKGIMYVDMSKV